MGRPKNVDAQCFLACAAAGREDENSNWSIRCVFTHNLVDNRCFPLVTAIFLFIDRGAPLANVANVRNGFLEVPGLWGLPGQGAGLGDRVAAVWGSQKVWIYSVFWGPRRPGERRGA